MPASIISCVCGLLTGMVYNNNICNIQKWRFPQWIRSFSSTYLIPLLGTTSPIRHFSSTSSSPSPTQLNNNSSSSRYDSSSSNMRQRNVQAEVKSHIYINDIDILFNSYFEF